MGGYVGLEFATHYPGIGDKAPDIAMRDPQGNIRKLSDLTNVSFILYCEDFFALALVFHDMNLT